MCFNNVFLLYPDLSTKNSVVNTVEQKALPKEKNGISDNNVHINIQSTNCKVQDVISIGSRYCSI